MSRHLLLLRWLEEKGHPRDYQWLADQLPSRPAVASMRHVCHGYRPASWKLCFELEALTGISAHDIRDQAVEGAA